MTRDQKKKLPEDVRAECIAILRGYERRKWSDKPEDRRRVEAIQTARERAADDYPEHLRGKICDAIIQNCTDGRAHPFETLGLSYMSRSDFYRRRWLFLYTMAAYLGIA